MTAFVDESIRTGSDGFYIVAAVIVVGDLEQGRDFARSLLLPGQVRLHWNEEGDRRRQLIVGALAELGAPSRVYVGRLGPDVRQARVRALGFNRLLWDLWSEGVDSLVIESRQEHNDRQDRRTILSAQRSRKASPTLTYSFARPSDEPLLWLPDVLAGAAAATVGGGYDYLARLGTIIERTDIVP
ncbi:MAG: hypothetical protein ACT452_08535 [Microthrixaceae bacterium]